MCGGNGRAKEAWCDVLFMAAVSWLKASSPAHGGGIIAILGATYLGTNRLESMLVYVNATMVERKTTTPISRKPHLWRRPASAPKFMALVKLCGTPVLARLGVDR